MAQDFTARLFGRVHDLILRERLLVPGQPALVAVSGGADSISLLRILHRLAAGQGWRLHVATFDHRWSDGSGRVAQMVADLATDLGLPCTIGVADEPQRSEAGARAQRVPFLETTAAALGIDTIALGHTADDRAETLLLNLLRGAGTSGLGAMGPRSGLLVRPLLEETRARLRTLASLQGWPFHDDPSNTDTAYLRNRLRHEAMATLGRLRPNAIGCLARAAEVCWSEREALDRLADRLLAERLVVPPADWYLAGYPAVVVSLVDWPALPHAERRLLARAAWRQVAGHLVDVSLEHVERLVALASARPDAGVLTLGPVCAARCRGGLLVTTAAARPTDWSPAALAPPDEQPFTAAGLTMLAGESAEHSDLVVHVAAPLAPFEVRMRHDGDRLRPLGRGGSRKLSDLLAEAGVPQVVRDRVPVICAGGQPIAVPGIAVDEAAVGELAVGVRFTAPSGS